MVFKMKVEKGVSGVKVTLNTGLETTTDGDGKYESVLLTMGSILLQ